MYEQIGATVETGLLGVVMALVAIAAVVAVVLVVKRGVRMLLGLVGAGTEPVHKIRISHSAPAGWTQADSDRLFAEADAEKGRRRSGG